MHVSGERVACIAAARRRLATELAQHPARVDVLARFDRWVDDCWDGLAAVYAPEDVLPRLVDLIGSAVQGRSRALLDRDRERLLTPDWFQRPDALGYVAYADLFADDLRGVASHVDYLVELGVTYLHLMPLLEPRPGPSDGGYAVAHYRRVRSDLGTMDDLAALAERLHESNISLTLDLVLNHVAREHEWARRARAGDARYHDYFLVYPDRELPDQYEASLPEVFPAFAPGNFTWDDEAAGWVWTTFNSWQWDLNWANPDVFCEFADIILFLANQGADCIRLDAIAFIWKRRGTNCQGQPEVHAITQALRAVVRIATPSVIFKAEAIVAPDDLVQYLGRGTHAGKVSDLANHNSLMVQIWSALATRNGSLMAQALGRFPAIPITSSWATYLRCHDDIGWAIDDADAAAVGWNGFSHRAFLGEFYAGDFPASFARGAYFPSNPVTGDARTSGSAASLAGLERALATKDDREIDLAIGRILCGYAMVLGFGGLPLIYMGDEIGLLNDNSYASDPTRQDDNRWMHRPAMPWMTAERRHDPSTVEGRIFNGLRQLIRTRARLASLHSATATEVYVADDPGVVLFRREHPAGDVVEVYNVTENPRSFGTSAIWPLAGDLLVDAISGRVVSGAAPQLTVPPYAAWWLVRART